MGDAAAEREQLFARIAVSPILLDRIAHSLLGEIVLELEGDDRETVDEQRDVQRPLRLVTAVAKLSRDGEAVLLELLPGLRVAGRWCAVEKNKFMRAVADSVPEHIDRAALRDLALQPREELAPGRTVLVEREGFDSRGLCSVEESGDLRLIDAVFAVVVTVATATPADAAITVGGLANLAWRGRGAGIASRAPVQIRLSRPYSEVSVVTIPPSKTVK